MLISTPTPKEIAIALVVSFHFTKGSDSMIKKAELINVLKQIKVSELKSDGPTAIVFNSGEGKGPQTFALSVQNEVITVTAGRFLFKRRYKIHRNEL